MDDSPNFLRAGFRFVRGLAVIYVLVALGMAALHDRLVYLPARATAEKLLAEGAETGLEPWKDERGTIIGWKTTRPPSRPRAANRLLVLHGNAGYAQNRGHFCTGYERLDGGATWEVYLFEYPGYGARPGQPSKRSLSEAVAAAWKLLHAADSRPLYVLGESIGSGPACVAASLEPPPAGLCLITPFRSLQEVGASHFPWLPVKLLLRNEWDNSHALDRFHGRTAVVLAGADEIIPTPQGQRLYDGIPGAKRLWVVEGVGHNGLDYSPLSSIFQETSDFLLGAPAAR